MTPLAQLILSFNRSMCDRQRATGPEPRRAESHDDPTMHRAEMPPTGSLSPDFTDGEGCDEYETWVEWCLMHGLEDGDGD